MSYFAELNTPNNLWKKKTISKYILIPTLLNINNLNNAAYY